MPVIFVMNRNHIYLRAASTVRYSIINCQHVRIHTQVYLLDKLMSDLDSPALSRLAFFGPLDITVLYSPPPRLLYQYNVLSNVSVHH